MPHLECVNEEFKHYFIVDTPPSSRSGRKSFTQNLKLY
jgi:hypothetical protein